MAKVEHKESPMKTECSLSLLASLFLRSPRLCLSPRRSLWAGRVRLRARYQNKQRWGWKNGVHAAYQRGEDERAQKQGKNQTARHEGNARGLLLLVHTYFHRERYHFKALKRRATPRHANTRDSQLLGGKKKNINSNSSPYQMYISPEGLEEEKKKNRERHSKDCNRLVMNKTLHQNWKDGEISFLSACWETRDVSLPTLSFYVLGSVNPQCDEWRNIPISLAATALRESASTTSKYHSAPPEDLMFRWNHQVHITTYIYIYALI